ncbi:HDOD domain-containing protein [Methylomagnum ishizawai]|uniref:HDOD domain-containing protein n=1 Tax=Methylomagnum ishizawai TaxID=1760988 RepID=A0A1Y6CW13_9GAMM|nr:HDOD domain-containing protein [Methylomagnum ishizawai]SMF94466.1 HDOD domain-containing protein [Methylomagnum ishizawai]
MNTVVDKFVIPAQPSIMIELNGLLNNDGVNMDTIAEVIGKDPALSAMMLRTVNTPFFSRGRKFNSIKQATGVMGLGCIRRVMLSAVFKSQYSKINAKKMELFWRHSELSAIACEIIARCCYPELSESAYLAGLFHDCAAPLFIQKYDDYCEFFNKHIEKSDSKIVDEENRRYSINHCIIGNRFCKAWSLPEVVCSGILYHHASLERSTGFSEAAQANTLVEKMVAILAVNDKIVQRFDLSKKTIAISLDEYMEKHNVFIEILSIDKDDLLNIKEDFLDKAFGA